MVGRQGYESRRVDSHHVICNIKKNRFLCHINLQALKVNYDRNS